MLEAAILSGLSSLWRLQRHNYRFGISKCVLYKEVFFPNCVLYSVCFIGGSTVKRMYVASASLFVFGESVCVADSLSPPFPSVSSPVPLSLSALWPVSSLSPPLLDEMPPVIIMTHVM